MSIRYVKPVPTDRELVVEGRITGHDERQAALRSTIHSHGTLLAESESSWMFPKLSSIAKIAKVDESTVRQFLARYP
jgi:acyl-CoA thioesterase FadM